MLRNTKLGRRKRPTAKDGQAKAVRKRRSSKRGQVSGDASDDSIGSASDLRAREEEEEEEEKEGAGETETINDSVLTCGSSAYHAETESMALEETITKCPRVPEVPETEGDMLFVGHSYGEKPLLADDELDTEEDNPPPRSPPLLITIQEDPPPTDVFALAPFQKPDSKKRIKREINVTPDSLLQLSTPSPPMLVAISPVVAEGSLVDLSDGSNEVSLDIKDSGFNTFSADYDSSKTFPIFPQDSIPQEVVVQADKDLFGSLPFIRHSNNPFTDGSEIISSNDGLYHKTSIVIGGSDSRLTSVEDPNQAFAYNSLPQVSNVFVSSTVPTISTNQDLFGSVPFDRIPKSTDSHYFVHRPTTLPVTSESLSCDVTNHLTQQIGEITVDSTADNSSPEALMLPEKSDLNCVKTKKEHHKLHSLSEKCKYHLIEETRKSPLQSKHKIVKSSVVKKTGKISKKIGKVSKTGFSNWSFEDFPSDGAEEAVEHSSSVPFEVLRDEKTPVESDRKFGSLKSRTNPFS